MWSLPLMQRHLTKIWLDFGPPDGFLLTFLFFTQKAKISWLLRVCQDTPITSSHSPSKGFRIRPIVGFLGAIEEILSLFLHHFGPFFGQKSVFIGQFWLFFGVVMDDIINSYHNMNKGIIPTILYATYCMCLCLNMKIVEIS